MVSFNNILQFSYLNKGVSYTFHGCPSIFLSLSLVVRLIMLKLLIFISLVLASIVSFVQAQNAGTYQITVSLGQNVTKGTKYDYCGTLRLNFGKTNTLKLELPTQNLRNGTEISSNPIYTDLKNVTKVNLSWDSTNSTVQPPRCKPIKSANEGKSITVTSVSIVGDGRNVTYSGTRRNGQAFVLVEHGQSVAFGSASASTYSFLTLLGSSIFVVSTIFR